MLTWSFLNGIWIQILCALNVGYCDGFWLLSLVWVLKEWETFENFGIQWGKFGKWVVGFVLS